MLYIHIGAQKTGSTTIQKIFYDNRDLLAQSGLMYVDVLPEDSNKVSHYNSVRGFFSNDPKEVEHTKKFCAQISDPESNYLISAENLSNWPACEKYNAYTERKRECVSQIKEEFSSHDVKIIFIVRDRAEYLKSLFKQHLKVNSLTERSIDQSLHDFLNRELVRSDFSLELDLWREAFEDVEVIDFDNFKDGTLVDEFCKVIGQPTLHSDMENLNVSPDWAALEMRRIGLTFGVEMQQPSSANRKSFNERTEQYVSSVILLYLQKKTEAF